MFPILICFLLSYVVLTASLMDAGGAALPAVAVVLAVRWFSPGLAAAWAFGLGVMLDGLGTGPLGIHAAAFVTLTALLPRLGFPCENLSAWQWMWAVFLTAWCDGAIAAAVNALPHHRGDALEQQLIHGTIAAVVTALTTGLWVGTWRQVAGSSCTTH